MRLVVRACMKLPACGCACRCLRVCIGVCVRRRCGCDARVFWFCDTPRGLWCAPCSRGAKRPSKPSRPLCVRLICGVYVCVTFVYVAWRSGGALTDMTEPLAVACKWFCAGSQGQAGPTPLGLARQASGHEVSTESRYSQRPAAHLCRGRIGCGPCCCPSAPWTPWLPAALRL